MLQKPHKLKSVKMEIGDGRKDNFENFWWVAVFVEIEFNFEICKIKSI